MPTYANPFGNTPGMNPFAPTGAEDQFYYNQVPEAGYWAWMYGYDPNNWGNGTQARWTQNQYGRMRNMFTAEAAQDPFMEWYPWLQRQKSPTQEYQEQGPDSRGEGSYRMYTPRARWIMPGG